MRSAKIVLAALAFAATLRVDAEGDPTIHRCIGAHGEIEFSGTPCGRPDATAAVAARAAATPRDAPGLACPSSIDTLESVVAAALARHDANAMVGLLRWNGVGAGEAKQRLRELADLGDRPLLGITSSESSDGFDDAPTLTVRTGSLARGTREHVFRIVGDGACYGLDW